MGCGSQLPLREGKVLLVPSGWHADWCGGRLDTTRGLVC